ncbi:ecto-NOX disulfide-thiol exchanger 1-like [Rhincodon typus]|uniref:ecto-NOX disulfide-thiol exchanger 1-like n=1 Tax=Rhincodon typus TaxID=259920 RepID=UPI00202FD489|nr:ecto-NOX disulfide-thiol exchanger 1-like [Rhincodon typus]
MVFDCRQLANGSRDEWFQFVHVYPRQPDQRAMSYLLATQIRERSFISIISTFLHVHPFGANIEYLWSYLQRLDAKISSGEIEMLLSQLPHMFKQEFTGVGATLEKRWKFCAFEGIKTVSQ